LLAVFRSFFSTRSFPPFSSWRIPRAKAHGRRMDFFFGVLGLIHPALWSSFVLCLPNLWLPRFIRVLQDFTIAAVGLHLTLTISFPGVVWVALLHIAVRASTPLKRPPAGLSVAWLGMTFFYDSGDGGSKFQQSARSGLAPGHCLLRFFLALLGAALGACLPAA